MSWTVDTILKKSNPPPDRPYTPPITEGMTRKGGRNQGPSQIKVRPPAPGKVNVMSDKINTSNWESAGRNLKYTTIDNVLHIAVPIDPKSVASAPASSSGKSKSIGSTLGNVGVTGTEVKFGVNVYTKA